MKTTINVLTSRLEALRSVICQTPAELRANGDAIQECNADIARLLDRKLVDLMGEE